ncbi:methyltransferase domain-containing protein [Sulfurimonas sp. SAG-AH-194-I05]|nr:methyltransferase domain-containing protein [Sulfurimonas sp. SAG-AH-194-I05]MDF1874510.1 methyltransferase domain-containing protein [Sulfurimonas sp. SAG-AH-194-I05]
MKKECPLCSSSAKIFYEAKQTYFQCNTCCGIFVDPAQLPSTKSEKARYEIHSDDTNDMGYRKFVSPLTSVIIRECNEKSLGLDFGAGASAIVSTILKESNYSIVNYDPYFHIYPELLTKKYDYISSCEVVEHFYTPYKEFTLLKNLLHPHAKIYIMTEPYHEGINFASWYYKNDPTHVFFYSKETFLWIKNEFNFTDVTIDGRLIIFENERVF